MRHHQRGSKLKRNKRQRVALLRSLARSLVIHEGITTTEARAKALRPFIERLVSISKSNTLASHKSVVTRLGGDRATAKKLHETIAPRYAKRAGGYTRVVRLGKIGKREAQSARVEFVK